MQTKGELKSIARELGTNRYLLTLAVEDAPAELNGLLDVELKKHRERRSKDANALLWACIGDIARKLTADKWNIYLTMLKRYGRFETIQAKAEAVPEIRKVWRETEVVDTKTDLFGNVIATIHCYIGSSSYNTQEMSDLINGVLSEMKEMGMQLPATGEVKKAIEEWEAHHAK